MGSSRGRCSILIRMKGGAGPSPVGDMYHVSCTARPPSRSPASAKRGGQRQRRMQQHSHTFSRLSSPSRPVRLSSFARSHSHYAPATSDPSREYSTWLAGAESRRRSYDNGGGDDDDLAGNSDAPDEKAGLAGRGTHARPLGFSDDDPHPASSLQRRLNCQLERPAHGSVPPACIIRWRVLSP